MITILIILTVLIHAIITGGTILVWNSIKKSNPAVLPKVFFASTAVRLVGCVIVFACAMLLIHDDMHTVKVFTAVFLAAYFLMLIIDTAYFYCSSQQLNKNNNQ